MPKKSGIWEKKFILEQERAILLFKLKQIEDRLDSIEGEGLVWVIFVNWQSDFWRKKELKRRILQLDKLIGSPTQRWK